MLAPGLWRLGKCSVEKVVPWDGITDLLPGIPMARTLRVASRETDGGGHIEVVVSGCSVYCMRI
jgi:hypothetical protein